MKTEFFLDYPTILANQARPVHFAIRFEADVVGKPLLQQARSFWMQVGHHPQLA